MITAVICIGTVGTGRQCTRKTTDPSGLCSDHRNAQSQGGLGDRLGGVVPPTLGSVTSTYGRSGDDAWLDKIQVQLRDEQRIVADQAFEVFTDPEQDRCQVRAACGMGKTIMEQAAIRKYDEYLQEIDGRSGNYLIVVPTIALANQMRDDILDLDEHGKPKGRKVLDVVYDERSSANSTIMVVHNESDQMGKPGSDSKEIEEFLDGEPAPGEPRVVIAVRNSIQKIADAQAATGTEFDISMFDEAHNYSAELKTGPREKSGIPTIYYNEQEGGIKSENRMFLSASPRLRDARLTNPLPRTKTSKETILEMTGDRRARAYDIDQEDEEIFGKFIGSPEWGYRYAVEKGYLSRTEFQTHDSRAWSYGTPPVSVTRETKVDLQGMVTGDDSGIMYGSYVTMETTAQTLANSDGRNVLAFSNSIEECEEMTKNWTEGLLAQSRVYYGGSSIGSDDDARAIIESPSSSHEHVTAAKLHLLARHANVIAASSKSSKEERERALGWFDRKERGDRSPCTCGSPGGWCACARVVSNVDIFSEGVSINSIDTVVINRASRTSDADYTQAIGRSSRKMYSDGVNQKERTRVVIPRMLASDQDVEVPVDDRNYNKALRSINRIWNNTEGHRIAGSETVEVEEDVELFGATLYDNSQGTVKGQIDPDGLGRDPDDAAKRIEAVTRGHGIVYAAWNTAKKKAEREYRKDTSQPFSDLSDHEKEQYIKSRINDLVSSEKSFGGSRRKLRAARDIIQNGSWMDYRRATTFLEDMSNRANVKESLPDTPRVYSSKSSGTFAAEHLASGDITHPEDWRTVADYGSLGW